MKTAAIILHSLWAGLWSTYLFWVSLKDLSWKHLQVEPFLIALPIAALGWLPFAIGLFFGRAWAWYGSFVCSVLALFVAFYVTWMAFAILQYEETSYFWELAGSLTALAVVAALLQTRRHFLEKPGAAAP